MRLAFIDSSLLYRGVRYRQWFVIYRGVRYRQWFVIYRGVPYRQWFVIYRGVPYRQWFVIYREVFKARLTVVTLSDEPFITGRHLCIINDVVSYI
jgi:hypothetical protein